MIVSGWFIEFTCPLKNLAMNTPRLRFLISLSILAALFTITLKTIAYFVTGSVGLLSDALESGINLIAALIAYFSLWYSSRPADLNHTYGHEKIEFFSSGLEGVFILMAGFGTAGLGVWRLFYPVALEDLELGSVLALIASVGNLVVGMILVRAGRKHHSIVLEADGKHLLTDVWTSLGVIVGLVIVKLTGFVWLDSLLAIAVGLHIIIVGGQLVMRSFEGLMDHALPLAEVNQIRQSVQQALPEGTTFHALRTRRAGSRRFADFHLLVPGKMSMHDAHTLAMQIEELLCGLLANLEVTIHLEPIEEPASYDDHAKGLEPE